VTAGVDRLRLLLADHLPTYHTADIRCLAAGVDHVAYHVGGEIVVRLAHAQDDEPADHGAAGHDADGEPNNETEREARLLRVVARYSTLPVPVPLAVADGMLAYRALPGVPLLTSSHDWRSARSAGLGDVLGGFLASLRSIPADSLTGIAEIDSEPPAAWLAAAQVCWTTIDTWATKGLPQCIHGMINEFLATQPPARGSDVCFSHNDLGAEHVLIDPDSGMITGVIDWADAAVTDPAVDLGLLLRDLGDGAFHAAARRLEGSDPTSVRDRAVFYARCRLLEDIAFGLENDRPEYLTNSVAAAERVFAG
jgi:aminoglycoside phosphotransferase (APT) family kinase protein